MVIFSEQIKAAVLLSPHDARKLGFQIHSDFDI
jgi:hypothetical protein